LFLVEKSRQKAKTAKKEDDTSWAHQLEETATPLDTAEDINTTMRTACSWNQYEESITSCLKAFANMCDTLTVDMLRNQFYTLPKPNPAECVVFGDPSNACKNRYSNVPCLDVSRILLEFLLLEDGGGYIHANRVTYPLLRNQFILTQGPLPRTVPEFWRMIWQENVETIIMLCRNIENGKWKCAEYLPNQDIRRAICLSQQLS
ncbi:Protein-tyrosine phosphatase, partial [Ancylostoma caninum]